MHSFFTKKLVMSSEERLGMWLVAPSRSKRTSFVFRISDSQIQGKCRGWYRGWRSCGSNCGQLYGYEKQYNAHPLSADVGTPREWNEVLQQLTSSALIFWLSISWRERIRFIRNRDKSVWNHCQKNNRFSISGIWNSWTKRSKCESFILCRARIGRIGDPSPLRGKL